MLKDSLVIFNLEIKYYALCILSGVLVAYLLGLKTAKKMGIKKDFISDGVLYCLPLAIVGARLYYVAFEWDSYKDNFIEVFKVWEGGLAIHGGIITAIIFIIIYCKKKKVNVWQVFDIVFPGFLLAQALGRFGNYYNVEAHGDIMGAKLINFLHAVFPDALIDRYYQILGSYFHPTYLYEACFNVLGCILIYIFRRFNFFKKGDSLPFYMVWYGIGRFFIEHLRTDSLYVTLFNHTIKQNQLISVFLVIGGIIIFILKRTLFKVDETFSSTVIEDYEITPTLNEMVNGKCPENIFDKFFRRILK